MALKTSEITLTLDDGSKQLFKLKELSWYESSLLTDDWSTLRYQEMCIADPVMSVELWKKIPRSEGRKLLQEIEKLNKRDDDTKKV